MGAAATAREPMTPTRPDLGEAWRRLVSLGLTPDRALCEAFAPSLAEAPRRAMAWAAWLAVTAPEERSERWRLILESGALTRDPAELPAGLLCELFKPKPASEAGRDALALRRIGEGFEGVAIAAAYESGESVRAPLVWRAEDRGRRIDAAAFGEVAARLELAAQSGYWIRHLALACLRVPELLPRLSAAPEGGWLEARAYSALLTLSLPAELSEAGCAAFTRELERVFALLRGPCGERARRLGSALSDLPADAKATGLSDALTIYERIPRVLEDSSRFLVLAPIFEGAPELRAALTRAPASALQRLEEASCRGAEALREGVAAFVEAAPELWGAAFAETPAALLELCRELGQSPTPAAWLRRALRQEPSWLAPGGCVEARWRGWCEAGRPAPSPFPRRLRAAFEGGRPLTDQQRARDAERVEAKLAGVRVAALRRTLEAELERLAGPGEARRHAWWLARELWRGRRTLRRALKEGGQREAHPLNRAWRQRFLERAPRARWEVWQRGLRFRRLLDDGRVASLAFEEELLEVLQMGTLARSCTGLGGPFSENAVAVALDINKRVVFARDEAGRFLARQVLALSEEGVLLVYDVYPADAPGELRRAFVDFARVLSANLRVPLRRSEEGELAAIRVADWYDDEPWSFGAASP